MQVRRSTKINYPKVIFFHLITAHACPIPGCQSVIVLDGKMKKRRHICNARDAGYIEYPGLPGKVKTGCMTTPEYKSRYCSQHQLRSCNFDLYEEISDGDMDEHAKGMYYLPMYIYTSKSITRGGWTQVIDCNFF